MNQHDPDAANDSRHNVVIGNTFDGRHLRHAILLQFRTHNNLVAENTIVGSHLDAIDLHGEGEYLNEIRDNTVIGGFGNKHKHDASGPGNWVHSNNLIGNRQGSSSSWELLIPSSRTIGSQLGKNRRPASRSQCTGHGVAR